MIPFYVLCAAIAVCPLISNVNLSPILPQISDIQKTHEFFAIAFIVAISTAGFQYSPLNRNRTNWPLYAMIGYLVLSIFNAPPYSLVIAGRNVGGFWMWEAFAWCLGYFMLYEGIKRIRIDHGLICKFFAIPAVISSFYAILQAMKFDQWLSTRPINEIGLTISSDITASIGNPDYLAVYLVACLPFCLISLRKRWAVPICISIILCQCDTANAGAVLMLALFFCMKQKSVWPLRILSVIVAFVVCCVIFCWSDVSPHIQKRQNGRFDVWMQAFSDWKSPPFHKEISADMSQAQITEAKIINSKSYALTGLGIGSFAVIYKQKHATSWDSAHNEYLETLYSIGLIGLGLSICMAWFVLWYGFPVARINSFECALYCSFCFLLFSAALLPVFHVDPLRFLSVVIFSLLAKSIFKH